MSKYVLTGSYNKNFQNVISTTNDICGLAEFMTHSLFEGETILFAILGERSGSVVECLTRVRGAAGSSLTGVTALWSLSKTHLS